MGLFSFIKSAGDAFLKKSTLSKKNRTREPAELRARQEGMLEGLIYQAGLKIEHLDCELEGDKLTVYGETRFAADRDKAILILGNVSGISEVDDRISLLVAEEKVEFYEIQKGDSLSKIAKKYYGDPLKYHLLFEANKEVIKDPNLIYPGQKIRIPSV